MTYQNKLMGLGLPAEVAKEVVGGSGSAVTCKGASAGGSPTIISGSFNILTAAASNTGCQLPAYNAATCQVGDVVMVYTTSGTSAVLYPATGETIDNNASVTVAQYHMAILKRVSSTLWGGIYGTA
jgi:hypothetical protein